MNRDSGLLEVPSSSIEVGCLIWLAIDVNIKLQELLPDEVLDELIIIHELLVVDFCPAFELHFFRIKLPFNFNFNQCFAYKLEHFLWISLELHSDVECSMLLHLDIQLTLIEFVVNTEWILWINVLGRRLIPGQIQPNSPLVSAFLSLQFIVLLLLSD